MSWFSYLIHFAEPSRWLSKIHFEMWVLLMFVGWLAFETLVSGWRNSSLGVVFRDLKTTDRWDLFSLILAVSGVRKILANMMTLGFAAWSGQFLRPLALDWPDEVPFLARLLLAVLIYDLIMYWNHRLRHEVPWFWIVHEFHHSSTRVTTLTDYRVHPLDYIVFFSLGLVFMPLLFGADVAHALPFIVIAAVASYFAHSRIDTNLGWVGHYILVTPRFHHLHHACDERQRRNYGHMLVVWDRMFGTFAPPNIPLAEISQGISPNAFESQHPVRSYTEPVLRFFLFPLRVLRFRKRSPGGSV